MTAPFTFDIGTVRKRATRIIRRELTVPDWMAQYLDDGNKILAIKNARIAYRDAEGYNLSLGQAKRLVESFTIHTTIEYEDDIVA